MSAPATFKYDLPNSAITPVQEGRTTVAYPFLPNGSIGPKVYTRRLLQQEAYYVPATMGLERDSVWPGGDPQAYLISETSPEHTGIGDMLRFTRSYARIPATQTVYGSRIIQRPIMHMIAAGGYRAVSVDNGVTSHTIASGNCSSCTSGKVVAGTYEGYTGITKTGHGRSVNDVLLAWTGDGIAQVVTILSVFDANTFYVDSSHGAGFIVYALRSNANARYVNGPMPCTVKVVTSYYLQGVTSGITTPADIPLVTSAIDPVSWLDALVAGTAYVVCEGSQLDRWLDGPIYSQTTISVQMSDANEQISVSA